MSTYEEARRIVRETHCRYCALTEDPNSKCAADIAADTAWVSDILRRSYLRGLMDAWPEMESHIREYFAECRAELENLEEKTK